MTASTSPAEPLGVGQIINETFALFFRRIVPIMIVGFVTALAGLVVNLLFVGLEGITGTGDPQAINPVGTVVASLIGMVFYGIAVSVLVLLAYDARLGRPVRLGGYLGASLGCILPVAVLTLLVSILAGVGMIFLILPGLWIYAVYGVIVPVIVIERAGFGAMGRSAALTRGYRWPIVGLLLVMGIVMVLILSVATAMIVAPFALSSGSGPGGGLTVVALVLQAALTAVVYGLASIMVALIYARLREVKEGVAVDSLVEVFR